MAHHKKKAAAKKKELKKIERFLKGTVENVIHGPPVSHGKRSKRQGTRYHRYRGKVHMENGHRYVHLWHGKGA